MPAEGRRHGSGARLTRRRLALSAISLPTRGGDATASGQMSRLPPQVPRGHTAVGYWPKMSLPTVFAHGLLRLVSASVSTCTLRPSRLTSGSGTLAPSELGLIHKGST